ncbi:N-acetylglucosamine-6-phosphate deacetylase [Pseudoprimorskyibacter insulae]|uniref:N-acetylglucosamine-6-phosphate deacetylase n=1 Tax=Pseudoprimorskyibacter insulae TaxID=1695997 RepID=A0A2R8AR23_9RHOB|nr:N-acetylglucosamine-6-phosphate deacetylase [Pseudoprimorskyibacter insulae]SPF78513.1 N-acetylglucosamine-6-phosphate deacetylase [Pseudoprimorskyibacter insulae]
MTLFLTADQVFDGTSLRPRAVVELTGDEVVAVHDAPPEGASVQDLGAGILAPGFVDLQVNGGGGVLLGDRTDAAALRLMIDTHAGLGATTILPTLITNTPEVTRAVLDAAIELTAQDPRFAGAHLEGPHLSIARKGAHDGALIRAMTDEDLTALCDAAQRLRVLKVTLAPESVRPDQVATLTKAGALVSLGHSDADSGACAALVQAGARCVTHLFNAMSQMTGRAPGLVGTALNDGRLHTGLIADGVHVDPAMIALALRAKQGPGRLFLVSDSMAVAGTDAAAFTLGGRDILRRDGRLTLADGTLAGADLSMDRALQVMVQDVGCPLEEALQMATSVPGDLIGSKAGRFMAGAPADMVHLTNDFRLNAVWKNGVRI